MHFSSSVFNFLRAIMSSSKPVHLMLSCLWVGQNPLYSVHIHIILFFNFSKDACFLTIPQEEKDSQRQLCLWQATLISSESLKLDMNSLFNLHWIIQICPAREEINTENKNLEGHKNQRWLRASKYRHYVIVPGIWLFFWIFWIIPCWSRES